MPLIVIDGIDGTGKSVQSKLLLDALTERGAITKSLDFPRYSENSSILVKQYLEGKFGSDPKLINPYLISPLYMIDRIISYQTDWKPNYLAGDWIVSNRYSTSNLIHQGAKLSKSERLEYINWNLDVEYGAFGLPQPDLTFLLDVPSKVSMELRLKRGGTADIHEADLEYLRTSRTVALEIAGLLHWHIINCCRGDVLRSPEEINADIMAEILSHKTGILQPEPQNVPGGARSIAKDYCSHVV